MNEFCGVDHVWTVLPSGKPEVVKICLMRFPGKTYRGQYLPDEHKKSSSGKSDELTIEGGGAESVINCYSDLSLPALSGVGIGTFVPLSKRYGLPRHHRAIFPLPFLISNVVRTGTNVQPKVSYCQILHGKIFLFLLKPFVIKDYRGLA